MRARMLNGYWVFQAPVGYRYESVPNHGKLLVRNEPLATIVTEALTSYASGRFETQSEVKRFLEDHPAFPKTGKNNNIVRIQEVKRLLTRPVYAGYLEKPDWDVRLRQGHHEALISFETYLKIQDRLKETAKAPARKDIGSDFPLRGFVNCADCDKPLTASWSKGKTALYPYYLCKTKECESYGKSIQRSKIEAEFEDLLAGLKPSKDLFEFAHEIFSDLWNERIASTRGQSKSIEAQLQATERQIENLLDRIVDASSPSIVSTYENRLQKLDEKKAELAEKIENCGRPAGTFEGTFRTSFEFLGNPQKLWASEHIEDKKMVLRLVFADKLAYRRNEGFRTPAIALPLRVLEGLKGSKGGMVEPRRIELPTSALRTLRSPS
jgi:site-specific DNA recombinase